VPWLEVGVFVKDDAVESGKHFSFSPSLILPERQRPDDLRALFVFFSFVNDCSSEHFLIARFAPSAESATQSAFDASFSSTGIPRSTDTWR
jgi:hypothetical protein